MLAAGIEILALRQIFFTDSLEKEKLGQVLTETYKDYELGKKGIGSRSQNITNKKNTLIRLANIRGLNINKEYENTINVRKNDQIGVYVSPFNFELNQSSSFSNFAYTKIDGNLTRCIDSALSTVFLLQKVDKVVWLMFDEYLKGFTKIASIPEEGTGFIDKFYVSKKRYLQPAKVNIDILDFNYNVWLPFGKSPEFPNYVDAKEEIKRRLKDAGFSSIKISFRQESIIS